MINLDDSQAVLKQQGGDKVPTSIDSLPKQLNQAWTDSQKIEIPASYKDIQNIIFAGMGGSRFPGIIVKELFKKKLKKHIEIQDDYSPPGWVDENTLVILSSYSGTTEEVLATAKAAKEAGAVKFIGITSGGDVETFCKENGVPCYVFDPVHNPSGQPRIGVGYTVGAVLGIFHHLGFLDVEKSEIENALSRLPELLTSYTIRIAASENAAKQMAQKIYDHYPYYAVSEFLIGVGNAVQNQTNETAKSISSFRVISELNHHLMEGLKFPETHRNIALFIFFYSTLYSPAIKKRFHITREVVEQNKIKTLWHELSGKTKIEQTLEMLGFGGYLTMYLSTLYEQNPTAIPYVDYFKKKLKEAK